MHLASQAFRRDVPFKGRLSYNRTPLFEFLIGYRINNSIKIALSYQHQAGITIQSKALLAFPDSARPRTDPEVAQFISNLSLDALMAKLYFELPYSLIFKNLATSPYLAVGIGPGWQTWSRVTNQLYERKYSLCTENPFRYDRRSLQMLYG